MAGSPFTVYHSLDYWLFIVLTIIIIIFSISWEWCLEEMEHAASHRRCPATTSGRVYESVRLRGMVSILQKVINELAILGDLPAHRLSGDAAGCRHHFVRFLDGQHIVRSR